MTLRGVVLTSGLSALVLVAAGPASTLAALQQQAAAPLAAALGVELLEPLQALSPDPALEALATATGGLAPLPIDPGLPLEEGRHWAAALGAWRQPVILLVAADQVETGLPAALHALMVVWQVPTLGLVQWGGRWDPQARRRDGLPWLGRLATDGVGEWAGDGAGDLADAGQEEQALELCRSVAARWAGLRSSLEEAPLA